MKRTYLQPHVKITHVGLKTIKNQSWTKPESIRKSKAMRRLSVSTKPISWSQMCMSHTLGTVESTYFFDPHSCRSCCVGHDI